MTSENDAGKGGMDEPLIGIFANNFDGFRK